MSTTSKTNQTSSKPTSVQKTIRPNSTSGLVISAKSATVTLSSQASSSSSSNDSSAAHSDYKSVLDIVQEYTEGRTLIDDKRVNTTKDLSLKDEPLGGGGRIVWKHRQKTRILPRSKRLPVTNVVEELFDSDLMDAIEWTTAES